MILQIKIGVSSCLLGNNVRYDGGNRLDRILTETLGRLVQYVPVCPEVECGMMVPREPMQLEGDPLSPRLITVNTQVDYTDKMACWAGERVAGLKDEELCGFIFKSRSPSCGMEHVKVYSGTGGPTDEGVGIFARTIMKSLPLLPVEDEARLQDPVIRENFIERVTLYSRKGDSSTGDGAV